MVPVESEGAPPEELRVGVPSRRAAAPAVRTTTRGRAARPSTRSSCVVVAALVLEISARPLVSMADGRSINVGGQEVHGYAQPARATSDASVAKRRFPGLELAVEDGVAGKLLRLRGKVPIRAPGGAQQALAIRVVIPATYPEQPPEPFVESPDLTHSHASVADDGRCNLGYCRRCVYTALSAA
eukprot:COSAG04_NODE_349_length_16104_cov_34.698032_9_plen_184_part_00